MSKHTTNPQALAESLITDVTYTGVQGTTTTICTLHVGQFVVVGKSACVDAAKFNPLLGEKYAREDALAQLTTCVAFWLACSELLEAHA